MRKIYLFMLTLIWIMGVTSANAEKKSLTLSTMSVTETQRLKGTGIGGNSVPDATYVFNIFGSDTHLSATGMLWGLHGNTWEEGWYPDFTAISETSFSYLGRQGYNGEFVGQMYTLDKDVHILNLSFDVSDQTSNLYFSVWKVSATEATLLTSKAGNWTAGQNYSFFLVSEDSEHPLLASGERLVLLWNSYTKGQKVTISNFSGAIYDELVYATVPVSAYEGEDTTPTFTSNIQLPVADDYFINDFLPENNWVDYEKKKISITSAANPDAITVKYTTIIPFAESYDDLDSKGKWVSMFTRNGRMHVYDPKCYYDETYKYPSIDRATFAKLSDRHFWGFIGNPFTSSTFKIANKGAGPGKFLYLTSDTPKTDGANIPLLMGEDGNTEYFTSDWCLELGTTYEGNQYYCIKANKQVGGNDQYINNYGGRGFMTTWKQKDNGSNIKFTFEIDTYETLKERALNAPFGAVHSLTDEARALIPTTTATVGQYQDIIKAIQAMKNEGVVPFEDGAYYYLRNYTPPVTGAKTYVLSFTGGEDATTTEVTSGIGDANNAMTYSDINSIWQISQAHLGDEGYTGDSEDIGVSKTIGRYVTHANSSKKLTLASTHQLSQTGSIYYFVNLGAGQHFMKNLQYNGSGQQAMNMPLSCNDEGGLRQKDPNEGHFKNSRDTWYGIPATSLDINLHAGNDGCYYATAHFPFAVSFSKGTDAYIVESIDTTKGLLNLKKVTGVIPAGTALLLVGENDKSTVNIIANPKDVTDVTGNKLQGVNLSEEYTGNISDVLVLGIGTSSNEVGFYHANSNITALRNNSAYLPASLLSGGSPTNGLKFNFSGDVTGIEGVNAGSNNSRVIYDLQGRRVNKLAKGIYIVNGKKVIR